MKKRRILAGVLILLLLFSVIQAVRDFQDDAARRQINEEAARLAGLERRRQAERVPPAEEEPEAPQQAEESLPEEIRILAGIDLDALREVNADVVGWIEIPETDLSYPILQGEDNAYYLKHTWNEGANRGGSIFLECTSSQDFSDHHTIIYGHRMQDSSMFGTLRQYNDPEFWQEHPYVYIVHDGQVERYDIFAACEAGVQSVVYRLDIEESGLEEELIHYTMERSVIDTGITPEKSDRLLTLSTCTGNGHANRWVVQAVLAETVPTALCD